MNETKMTPPHNTIQHNTTKSNEKKKEKKKKKKKKKKKISYYDRDKITNHSRFMAVCGIHVIFGDKRL